MAKIYVLMTLFLVIYIINEINCQKGDKGKGDLKGFKGELKGLRMDIKGLKAKIKGFKGHIKGDLKGGKGQKKGGFKGKGKAEFLNRFKAEHKGKGKGQNGVLKERENNLKN